MRMLGFSHREVERRMGLNHGSVSQVLSGIIEAKLELVLGAARAIGLEYDEFFAFAYPDLRRHEDIFLIGSFKYPNKASVILRLFRC